MQGVFYYRLSPTLGLYYCAETETRSGAALRACKSVPAQGPAIRGLVEIELMYLSKLGGSCRNLMFESSHPRAVSPPHQLTPRLHASQHPLNVLHNRLDLVTYE